MSSLKKLADKFVNDYYKVTENDCRQLLNMLGYIEKIKSGSECVFHKSGSIAINVPRPKKGKYVKSPYVTRISKLLELEQYLETEKGEKNEDSQGVSKP